MVTLWCCESSTSLEGEQERGAASALAHCLPPSVPPCISKEGVRQGRKAVRYGWLAVFLIMSLSSVFWSLNSVINGLSCAKWLFRACKFGPCCTLPSGEELLPPPAVERGWAYLSLDDTNALQRFLSLDSGLWLVNLCHE